MSGEEFRERVIKDAERVKSVWQHSAPWLMFGAGLLLGFGLGLFGGSWV
jgi:hypothetical protein